MDILSIIIIALLGLFAVIGIIAGSIKGFTKAKSWAVELVLTGLIGIAVSHFLSNADGPLPAIITLAVTLAAICVLMLLFSTFRKLLSKRIEKRKQLSYYKQYDEMSDNTEQILGAIGTGDKKKYKKLSKRKFRQSGGAWSVVDKVFGAITLAIKGAVIGGLICAVALTIIDFTGLAKSDGAIYAFAGKLYETGLWQFFRSYIFDFIIVGLLMACIKSGFASGITSSLWSLLVFAMVVGAAVLSFRLAFNAPDFVAAAEGFEGKLSDILSGAGEMLGMVGITTLGIAKAIIGLLMFILMLVAIILFSVFVPKLIDRARESSVFRGFDGVFGAIILTVIILVILLVVGAVVNSFHDAAFMAPFNVYFEKSGIATYIYDRNLLNAMGILTGLPFTEWFV